MNEKGSKTAQKDPAVMNLEDVDGLNKGKTVISENWMDLKTCQEKGLTDSVVC